VELLQAYREKDIVNRLLEELGRKVSRPMRIMEVCGTHTMSIFRSGLRSILPTEIELLSGPGCPVCVTPQRQIDLFISIARKPNVRIATFGDLMRIPGATGSLAQARADGAKIEVVYSPIEALDLALAYPDELVVFLGIGFETTAPGVAATILAARSKGIANFSILCAHKTMPRALDALLAHPDQSVDGLLCPGHVSAIIGSRPYDVIAQKYSIPCVITGFEPVDIVMGLVHLATLIGEKRFEVINAYQRVVAREGNVNAQAVMKRVFEPVDSEWRGLGTIAGSGLALRDEWRDFDVLNRLDVEVPKSGDPVGCKCGEVLLGKMNPTQCPLFGKRCTPVSPVGPCMVSSEGTCAAYYQYRG